MRGVPGVTLPGLGRAGATRAPHVRLPIWRLGIAVIWIAPMNAGRVHRFGMTAIGGAPSPMLRLRRV